AGHLQSLVAPAVRGSPDYLRLRPTRYAHVDVDDKSPLLGKRIRIAGWLKTADVDNWAGLGCIIQNRDGHIFAIDETMDRPVRGTHDWQQIQIVADVPPESCWIEFGAAMYGTGQIWMDDFQIDVVSTNTPITDDRLWHKWSPNAADYSVGPDPAQPHG